MTYVSGVRPPRRQPVLAGSWGTTSGATLMFGSGNDAWGSYTYAASGQTAPAPDPML